MTTEIKLPSGGSLRWNATSGRWQYYSGNCILLRELDAFESEMVESAYLEGQAVQVKP